MWHCIGLNAIFGCQYTVNYEWIPQLSVVVGIF